MNLGQSLPMMDFKNAFILCFLFGVIQQIEGQLNIGFIPIQPRPGGPLNEYCYESMCQEEEDISKACNVIIDGFCGLIKTTLYGAEPVCVEMPRPLRCNCCIRGGCNLCRFGEGRNQYKNEEINIFTFGISAPHLFFSCNCDILLVKNYPLIINATNYKLQLVLEVNKLNSSKTRVLQSKILHPQGRFTVATRDLLTGNMVHIPAIFLWPVRFFVNNVIPLVIPFVMSNYADRIQLLFNCPTVGDPRAARSVTALKDANP